MWHIPDTEENRIRFKITPLSQTTPSEEAQVQIEKFKQWMRSKWYSKSTIVTYCEALKITFTKASINRTGLAAVILSSKLLS